MVIAMEDRYYDKHRFVKDFVALCSKLKKENKGIQFGFLHKFFSICGELWSFCIYIENDVLSTSATLIVNGRPVEFPKTIWGEPYSRWDYELREFLIREVCK